MLTVFGMRQSDSVFSKRQQDRDSLMGNDAADSVEYVALRMLGLVSRLLLEVIFGPWIPLPGKWPQAELQL